MEKQLILKSPIPEFLDKESDTFDASKVLEHDIFYFYDRKFAFVQADLELFQSELNESIKWQLWVKIDIDTIINIENLMDGSETVVTGELYSSIYFFQNSEGAKVEVVFESGEIKSPRLRPKPESHVLHKDFIEGVEKFKFLRWSSFLNS